MMTREERMERRRREEKSSRNEKKVGDGKSRQKEKEGSERAERAESDPEESRGRVEERSWVVRVTVHHEAKMKERCKKNGRLNSLRGGKKEN